MLLPKMAYGDRVFDFWIDLKTDGIENEGTGNYVVIRFLDEDGEELYKKVKNGLKAGKRRIRFAEWGDSNPSVGRVEVHVEGTDAIMIDRAWLKQGNGGLKKTTIGEWGVDNDKGWCISEDPDDINGSWSDSASQCSPGVSFRVGGSADYLQAHNYFRSYRYCWDLDTDGVSFTDSKSLSPITFQIFSEKNRKIHEDSINGEFDPYGSWTCLRIDEEDLRTVDFENNVIVPSDWDNTSFKIDIGGSDAFLIDRIKKETFGSNKVQYWGANNDYGWCLSTDPDDINGSFSGHAQGCYDCIQWYDNGGAGSC